MSAPARNNDYLDPPAARSVAATPRQHVVAPPAAHSFIDVWPEPVWLPAGASAPSFWLVGAHGGAGASSLAALWPLAGDAHGCFPGGAAGESPFVVIVARESEVGLSRAHDLINQHLSGHGGPGTVLVGLVLVAAKDGAASTKLRHHAKVISGLVSDRVWRIPWMPHWLEITPADITPIAIDEPVPTKRRDKDLKEVIVAAHEIRDVIRTFIQTQSTTTPSPSTPHQGGQPQ